MSNAGSNRLAAAVGFLTVLNVAVWGWSVGNGFVFDDLINIQGNAWIRDWALLPQAFLHHAAGFDPDYSTSFYRPMMHVLYATVHAMAGPQPWAYHLLNVAFNLVAAISVYVLVRAVLDRWGDPARHPFAPIMAAIIFSVHPIHTEPVLWVAGITDLSYTAFGLLALIAYLRSFSRARPAPFAAVLLFVSLLCKETGAVILLAMVVFEWIEARRDFSWTPRAAVIRLVPAVVAFGTYLALRLVALGSFAPSAAQHARGPLELASGASALFARYMAVLAVPVRLSVMRSIPFGSSFADPAAVAGLVAGASVVVALWFGRRSVVIALSLVFAVLPILPVLYTPAIESGESVFGERYLYLSVLGIGLAAGCGLDEARRRRRWALPVAIGVMIVFVGWGATVAVERTRVWSSSLSLWTDAVSKAPDSSAAHEGLCFALYSVGRFPEALDSCGRALALDPRRVDARTNRANALLALGRAREARDEFDIALSIQPKSAEALVNRGLACMMLGQPDEAMLSYRQALDVDPNFAEAYNVIGVALARSGRRDEALAQFERAVRLAPENQEYRANLRVVRGGIRQD